MYIFVETQKATYLAETATEKGSKTILANALLIKDRAADPEALAKQFVRALVSERLQRTVSISSSALESTDDAEEVSPLIEVMIKFIPIAEKRARARLIMEEIMLLANVRNTSMPELSPELDEDGDCDYKKNYRAR